MKKDYMARLERAARWRLPPQEAEDVIADDRDIVSDPPRTEEELRREVGDPEQVIKLLVSPPRAYYTWLAVFAALAFCLLAAALAPLPASPSFRLSLWYEWFSGYRLSDPEFSILCFLPLFQLAAGMVLCLVWFLRHREAVNHPRSKWMLLCALLLAVILAYAWSVVWRISAAHSIERIRREVVTTEDGIDTLRPNRIDPAFPRGFVIYELLSSAYGFKGDVVDALCRALDQGATGRRFYSRERTAYIDRGKIVVAPTADDDPCLCEVERQASRSYCGNAVLYYEYTDIDTIKEFGVPEQIAQVDADKLQYPLTLRRWQEGDWFVPFGMTGRKKVSDFLTDAKVSAAEKQRQFVLLSGDDIVWLVGRRIDDRYRLTEETENVLRIIKEIV